MKVKITVIDYFKAQKESDDYLKENPSEFYDENQIFSDELFNTYENPSLYPKNTIKGVSLTKPLFEFSGACAGCGETPYIKLLTQIVG